MPLTRTARAVAAALALLAAAPAPAGAAEVALPAAVSAVVERTELCRQGAARMPAVPPIPDPALAYEDYVREIERRNAVVDGWIGFTRLCRDLAAVRALVSDAALERARAAFPAAAALLTPPSPTATAPDVQLAVLFGHADRLALLAGNLDKLAGLNTDARGPIVARAAPAQPPLPTDPPAAGGAAPRVSAPGPASGVPRRAGVELLSIVVAGANAVAYLRDADGTRYAVDSATLTASGVTLSNGIRATRVTPCQVTLSMPLGKVQVLHANAC